MSYTNNVSGSNVFSVPDNTGIGNLNGFFKDTWESQLNVLIPDGVKILNKISFMPKEKMPGNLFHCPVVLGLEHGVTFGSETDDYMSLNSPIAGSIKDATVRGAPMILRSILGYTAASRAAQGGQAAFMDATKFLVANMLRSITKKLEIEMLYGKMGYGVVDAAGLVGSDVVIKTSEWASGIWAGAENLEVDFFTGNTLSGQAVISAVDLAARKLTLTASGIGLAGILAGDVIFPKGYKSGATLKSFLGVHAIMKETSSLYNIDCTKTSLFKGNIYDASGAALSFTKLNLAAARAVEKGLEGALWVLVNPRTWANLMNDQAALRKYDASYSSEKVELGSKAIKFYSQNGELEIEPSIYVKEGYAYMLSIADFSRIGSTDVTFKRPGQGDQFFRDMENASGYELRCFSDQALFCSAPGRSVLIENIVNAN